MGSTACERFHQRQLLGGIANLEHAVEAGVADDVDLSDAELCEELAALLVLNEKTREALQYARVLAPIPAEEHLLGAEDAADAVDGHLAMLQDVQVVVPELILDEECHDGPHGTQEPACIADGVEWQIAHDVGTLVVLPDLVARRREEREQDFILRMVAAQPLHERASLFELAQRRCVEPHVLRLRVYALLEDAYGFALATPHLAHLLAEQTRDGDAAEIEVKDYLIHNAPPTAPEGASFAMFTIQ